MLFNGFSKKSLFQPAKTLPNINIVFTVGASDLTNLLNLSAMPSTNLTEGRARVVVFNYAFVRNGVRESR